MLPRLAAGIVFAKYDQVGTLLKTLLHDTSTHASMRALALSCAVALICHEPLCSQMRHADAWRTVKPIILSLYRAALVHAITPPDATTRVAAVQAIRRVLAAPPPALAALLSRTTRRACQRAVFVAGNSGDGEPLDGDEDGEDTLADDDRVVDALTSSEGVVVNALRVLALLGADLPAGQPSLLANLRPADVHALVSLFLPCLRVDALVKTTLTMIERAADTPHALLPSEALRTLAALCAMPTLSKEVLSHYADALAALCAALGPDVVGPLLMEVANQLLPMLRHNDATIRRSAAAALERVLTTSLVNVASIDDPETLQQVVNAMMPLCDAMRDCLRTPFRQSWTLVLEALASMAACLGAACEPLLGATLQSVADLYAASESSNDLMLSMRRFVAAMLRAMGPSRLLSLLPLNIHANALLTDTSAREWMLPLLRENIPHSRSVSLDLFVNKLLPLADQLGERAKSLLVGDSPTDAVLARLLQQRRSQLWALLPAICSAVPSHTDTATTFAHLAQRLAQTLEHDPPHRAVVAQSLSALIDSNYAVLCVLKRREADPTYSTLLDMSEHNVACARANMAAIVSFAGKFLPRLVNALAQFYDPNAGPQPNAVATTDALSRAIGHYGRIAPPELGQAFFGRVLDRMADAAAAAGAMAAGADLSTLSAEQKMLSEAERRSQRFFLTSVAAALAPALQKEQTARLLSLLTPQLAQSTDRQLQKVSFRALEALCRDADGSFLDDNWNAVLSPLLVDSMARAVPAAKRLRMTCIASALERRVAQLRTTADALARQKTPGKKTRRRASAAAAAVSTLALELLPSAILCTSEANKRTRIAAMSLIDDLTNAMRRAGDDGGADHEAAAVRAMSFTEQVAAGLAGASPVMIAATTRVLARVIRNYRSLLSDDVVGRLCDLTFLLLSGDDKQLARSAVIFARAALSVRKYLVRQRLPTLVPQLARWVSDPHHRFRNILRALLERLIARFGFDAVAQHVNLPVARRVINGLRQRATRREHRRANDNDDEDGSDVAEDVNEDDEGDDELADPTEVAAPSSRKRRAGDRELLAGETLLQDGDEPLDFLDQNSMRYIVSLKLRKRNFASEAAGGDEKEEPFQQTADGRFVVPADEDEGESEDDVNDVSDESDLSDHGGIDRLAGKQWKGASKAKSKFKRSAGGDRSSSKRSAVNDKDVDDRIGSVQRDQRDDDDGDALQLTEESVRARRRRRRIEARRRAVRAQLEVRQGKGRHGKQNAVARPGAEFKARRGTKGDVQRAGELQPYAYVPLNPAALSNRRRKEANAELRSVIEKQRKKSRRQ